MEEIVSVAILIHVDWFDEVSSKPLINKLIPELMFAELGKEIGEPGMHRLSMRNVFYLFKYYPFNLIHLFS